jgi:elongation factor Ts
MITTEMVKSLREKTGAGVMECKAALEEAKGDLEKAVEILRKKGIATAEKKSTRTTSCGLISSYIHSDGRIGVLLEVNCETDFVARTEEFKNLVKELAMQIAAASPSYISREDVPEEVIEKEKEIYREIARSEGKKEEIIEKIVTGKLEKFYQNVCLLDQPYIRDDKKKVSEIIKETIGKLKENIVVKRFVRYRLGE